MKMKITIGIALLAAGLGWSTAQAGVSGISVNKKIDPRSSGMGGAALAVTDDVFSLYINPAGLTYLRQSELASGFALGLMDDAVTQLAYASTSEAMTTWALGLMNYNLGQFDYLDFEGNTQRFNAGSDWVLHYAYAARLTEFFRFGVGIKLLHSTLLEKFRGTTLALDLGGSFDLPLGLRYDLVARNLGLPLTYTDDPDDMLGLPFKGGGSPEYLPLVVETGISCGVLASPDDHPGHDLILAASTGVELDREIFYSAGAEYWYYKTIALRAGYAGGRALDGISLGAGLRYPVFAGMPMQLDYSLKFSNALNYRHDVALSLDWAPNSERSSGAQVMEVVNTFRPSRVKIGAGVGGSYALLGATAEFMTTDYFSLFVGLGAPGVVSYAYSAGGTFGIRGYFGDSTGGVRGRFSGYLTGVGITDGGVGVFPTGTIGLEWRFVEFMSLNLDVGGSVGLNESAAMVPMADLGLAFHICSNATGTESPQQAGEESPQYAGEKSPQQAGEEPPQQAGEESPQYEQASTIMPVTLLLPQTENANESAAIQQLHLKEVVMAKKAKGGYVVLGMINNHGKQSIINLEAKIAFYNAQGNTVASWSCLLFDSASAQNGAVFPQMSRRIRVPIKQMQKVYSGVSLQIISAKTSDQMPMTEVPAQVVPKLGFGFGTPYGVLGGNFELMFAQTFGLYVGLGTMSPLEIEEVAFQVGARLYLVPPHKKFRLRAGLGYGTGALFGWKLFSSTSGYFFYEVVNATQPSLGFEWKLSKNFSIDFDAIYQIYQKNDANLNYFGVNFPLHLENSFKIALGMVFHLR